MRSKVLPISLPREVGGFTTRLVVPGSKAARFSGYLYRSKWEGYTCSLFSGTIIPTVLILARVFCRQYVPVLVMCFTEKLFCDCLPFFY